ncbi:MULTISPECIES: hypothetical protein [Pantoea]|nr:MULTISPECIES: hypothetical protein [Pantoea]
MNDKDETEESGLWTATMIPSFDGAVPCHALHKPAPPDDRDNNEQE